MDLYVISVQDDMSFVLTTQPKDLTSARQSISWQRRGGFEQPFHICRYDPDGMDFVSIETGQRFVPTNAGLTEDAWNRFLTGIDVRAADAGGFGVPSSNPKP